MLENWEKQQTVANHQDSLCNTGMQSVSLEKTLATSSSQQDNQHQEIDWSW